MKKCLDCNETKAPDQFSKDRSKPDGLNAYCKPCSRARTKAVAMRPYKHVSPEGFKFCRTCKETKPISEFHLAKEFPEGTDRRCKACRSAQFGKWRENNKDKVNAYARDYRSKNPEQFKRYDHKRLYGLAEGEFDTLLELQGGGCAICGTQSPKGKGGAFHVDHCHTSGAVRGILCSSCNTGLGHFRDSVSNLEKAISYLRRSP